MCNAFSFQLETRAPGCAYAQVCLQAAVWRAGICCWCARLPGSRKPLVPRFLLSCSRQCGASPPLSALASNAARCRTPTRGITSWAAGAHARPARALSLQAAPAWWQVGRWTAAGGGRRGASDALLRPSCTRLDCGLFDFSRRRVGNNNGSNRRTQETAGHNCESRTANVYQKLSKTATLSDASTK
jgi:hypothetical protein